MLSVKFRIVIFGSLSCFCISAEGALTAKEKKNIAEYLTPFITKCSEVHPITDEELTSALDKGSFSALNPCINACIVKKAGIINNRGQIMANKIYDIAEQYLSLKDQSYAPKILGACGRINENEPDAGDNLCDQVKPLLDCGLPFVEMIYSEP